MQAQAGQPTSPSKIRSFFNRRDKSYTKSPSPPNPVSPVSPLSSSSQTSAPSRYTELAERPRPDPATRTRDTSISPPLTNVESRNQPQVQRQNHHDARLVYVQTRGAPPRLSGRHVQAPWYIKNPRKDALGKHPNDLCINCQHINFEYLFLRAKPGKTEDAEDYIRLGPMTEIARQSTCPFCTLVASTVSNRLRRDVDGKIILDPEARRLLSAKWYLSPFVYAHTQYRLGFQLFLRPNIREEDGDPESAADTRYMNPSWPFVVRLINGQSRGGRRIPDDHLDYTWIVSTMSLCDKSTDMPFPVFAHPLRAVDVFGMRIVDLPADSDYVALSYAWGKVDMVTLSKQNESFLRSPGSLITFANLPQTMRDAIVLVRNVGQEYLWIDSLCVVQDDATDMDQQMHQMGQIYLHAYFTIFAISGYDANYGLPGVRPGSRKLKQAVQNVGDLVIASSLPFMEEEELVQSGAWGARGWTFQERFKSQRGLFVGDNGMIINCMHTYSPEDEHCFHTLERNEDMIATGDMFFYSGQHKECVPYLKGESTSFDTYAMLISEYSQRKLTFQSDAKNACLGILETLNRQLSSDIIHGLPETEFDAALLWSPIGSSVRRCDPQTKKPLFPSWSWLGWEGHAAWPWTLDRDTYMSTITSPLTWYDGHVAQMPDVSSPKSPGMQTGPEETFPGAWFTSADLCLPPSPYRDGILKALQKKLHDRLGLRTMCDRARVIHPEWLSKYQIDWPNGKKTAWQYSVPFSHKIRFRTWSADFYIIGKPFKRRKLYNMQHPIWRLSVRDRDGDLAGYIDIPDPASRKIRLGKRRFIVLSRSTIDGNFEPGPDALGTSRRVKPEHRIQTMWDQWVHWENEEEVANHPFPGTETPGNEAGNFSAQRYPTNRPWCMFNVMMLRQKNPDSGEDTARAGVYERDAIGRIHVDAFLAADIQKDVIDLE